ncbi:hypothetical protein DLAC_10838 [Tieghemostelium lacteum]|uniref:Uncharacterized protein n=1 Tax=Tieghemostelium lacteum TaxID=361077 RepID=A0A151Z3W8_TIELA|nr:hypothetical protein DLAC_10838 [Tieghemostelium lacteum]|eukprot:KYQ88662.1 hypothetical protein DLAC_10838 [Tieghemostelium lacteum]
MSKVNKNEPNYENTILELKKELEILKNKRTEDEIKKGYLSLKIYHSIEFYEGNQDEDLEIFLKEFLCIMEFFKKNLQVFVVIL